MEKFPKEVEMSNERYVTVGMVPRSSDRRKNWKVKLDKARGLLTCNCPAWIFQRGERHPCKHIQAIVGLSR